MISYNSDKDSTGELRSGSRGPWHPAFGALATLSFFVIILCSAMALGAQTAKPGRGLIQVCKVAGFPHADYQRSLSIPTGYLFKDLGMEGGAYGRNAEWPLAIETLQPAVFARGQDCVVVVARIADESKVRAVLVLNRRHLAMFGPADPNGPIATDIFPIGNSPPLFAHVISDFY